jgi:hypothetical protein
MPFKDYRLRFLLVFGIVVPASLSVGSCKGVFSSMQPLVVTISRSDWSISDASGSGVVEVFHQGEGVEGILSNLSNNSIATMGNNPDAGPLKASSATLLDHPGSAEFLKSALFSLQV